MNAITDPDATSHYAAPDTAAADVPSLLTIVLDTNPRAWAALDATLPLSKAVASLLIFVNGHLAFSNANQVALIASHTDRATWLYPARPEPRADAGGDVDMQGSAAAPAPVGSANKYPLFAQVEAAVTASLREISAATTAADLGSTTTKLSGALTMALSYINRASQSLTATPNPTATDPSQPSSLRGIRARILVVSVSDSQPSQYIPTMNAVFAASHLSIPIDTLSLSGNSTFLQQAAFITDGTFLKASEPRGILQYLMTGLMPDGAARDALVAPRHHSVDFRAACFCHRRVIDTGFVCSVCLGIFCEVPPGAACLLCGNKLKLGSYGAKPAVVPRKKKRRKRVNGREETGSATGTPRP